MKILDWVLARLAEESTWRGIILLTSGFCAWMTPEMGNAIMALGLSSVGVINIAKNQAASKSAVASAVNAATVNIPRALVIDEQTLLPKR